MRAHRSAAFLLLLLVAGCAGIGNAPPGTPQPTQTGRPQPAPHPLDPQQAERIRRIMAPLVAAMDHPRPLSQVRVGIMDDPHVNAASAGGGEFYVTTGLLQKGNDDQLRGVYSGRITPIAGALVTSSYSRAEEYAADRHGVDILTRAGYAKTVMINTLTWLVQTEGASSGGILASHPGTQERIDALKKL
jgi:predicted Zn-dependent protease